MPSVNGLALVPPQALEVSWSSQNSYTDVTVSASVEANVFATTPQSATAYLTTEIGPGATPSTEIVSTTFTLPYLFEAVRLFNNLSLGPGTYYLVLYSSAPLGGYWQSSVSPNQIMDAGVTIGTSGFALSDSFPFPYPPDLPFTPNNPPEGFSFEVDGNRASAVPEPSSTALHATAFLLGLIASALLRRKFSA